MDTREDIMRAARLAVQARGYHALSFRDLAKEVGVKSASVHYHFPTKGDLAAALAHRYATEAEAFLTELLAASLDHEHLMATYAAVFRKALEDDNRMCLCGIMAAESSELPADVRAEVERFTRVNAQWLERVLANRHPASSPELLQARALAIFAAIEGAQLVARSRGDVRVYDQIIGGYVAAGLFS